MLCIRLMAKHFIFPKQPFAAALEIQEDQLLVEATTRLEFTPA